MKINSILSGLLLAVSVFAVVEVGLLVHSLRVSVTSLLIETKATVAETRAAVSDLRLYADEQIVRLRDPRNSKAIDAAIQTAAVFNGTGRLINTQVIPRVMKTLDGLAESTASLDRMIQQTDRTVNAELAPEAIANLQSSNQALKDLSKILAEASVRANISLDDIHNILSNPAIAASQQNAQAILEHTNGAMQHAETSMGYVEQYLSPKKASFWMRLISLFIPKLTVRMN